MPSSKLSSASPLGLAGLALLMLFSFDAGAADKDPAKAAKEQVRRLQEQKRGLEMEKNQMLQDKEIIAKKLEVAEGEVGKKKIIESKLLDAQQRLRSSADSVEKLKAELAELKSRLSAKDSEMVKLNSQFEGEKTGRGLAEKSLAACATNNEAMYRQGRELLRAFARGGSCDAVGGEPLLGLTRISQENALESARDSLDAQRYREAVQN